VHEREADAAIVLAGADPGHGLREAVREPAAGTGRALRTLAPKSCSIGECYIGNYYPEPRREHDFYREFPQ
jgi:hypothetical protein